MIDGDDDVYIIILQLHVLFTYERLYKQEAVGTANLSVCPLQGAAAWWLRPHDTRAITVHCESFVTTASSVLSYKQGYLSTSVLFRRLAPAPSYLTEMCVAAAASVRHPPSMVIIIITIDPPHLDSSTAD